MGKETLRYNFKEHIASKSKSSGNLLIILNAHANIKL